MQTITVGRNDAGQRLDKFLTKTVPALPASLMYKYIRTKKIKVNRARTMQNYMLAEGDTIQLFIREEFFSSPKEDGEALYRIVPKLNILYEDENILLLNKRPGILVHEDTAGAENTLILHVQAYLAQKGEYRPEEEQSFAPALCNRIDRNTGGIVIAAKNAEALRVMNEKIRNDELLKSYLCAVHGILQPKEATLVAYLKKNENENLVRIRDNPTPGYKQIVTRYRTLREKNGNSLLMVDLITGRTHQIRAHFSHIGHPLLGDGKYGINRADREKGYKYQALYAFRLRFKKTDRENPLSYLEGKTFEIPMQDVWFLSDFGENL